MNGSDGGGAENPRGGEIIGPEPAPGSVIEAGPGVFVLPLPVPFPPGTVNALALEDARGGCAGWTVIDPGLAANEGDWRAHLGPGGLLAGRPIFRVIATHHHPDHIGLAGWFQSVWGAELWTTRTAWLHARMLQLDAWTVPPEAARAFHRRAGYTSAMMARYEARAAVNFSVSVRPMPLGFRRIIEGETIEIGAGRWRVLFGRGHAPDHALLWNERADLLIAGDQILPRISPNIGVYATEPEADPIGDWLASCDALAATLSDSTLVAPGHGPLFRGAAARAREMATRQRAKLDRLATHLRTGPHTVVDCFPGVYRRAIPTAAEGLATVETIAHLHRLRSAGRAIRRARADGVWLWGAFDGEKGVENG